MLYLTKKQERFVNYIGNRLPNSPNFQKSINKADFSVSNISLSYRQINELGKAKLIIDTRNNNKKGWRKFNIKEALYLNIISKLKEGGLTAKQLVGFKNSFYKNNDFEKVFWLILSGENIILSIDENGKANYFDWLYFVFLYKRTRLSGFRTSIIITNVWEDFVIKNPKSSIFRSIANDFLEKAKRELGDYPDEMGMTEEETKKLLEKLFGFADILFDKWVTDVKK